MGVVPRIFIYVFVVGYGALPSIAVLLWRSEHLDGWMAGWMIGQNRSWRLYDHLENGICNLYRVCRVQIVAAIRDERQLRLW